MTVELPWGRSWWPRVSAWETKSVCLAIPGKLLSIQGDEPFERTGRVSFGGVVKEVNLPYVPNARVGDYVIVHVGFALSMLDEQEAHRVYEYLQQIDDLAEVSETSVSEQTPS